MITPYVTSNHLTPPSVLAGVTHDHHTVVQGGARARGDNAPGVGLPVLLGINSNRQRAALLNVRRHLRLGVGDVLVPRDRRSDGLARQRLARARRATARRVRVRGLRHDRPTLLRHQLRANGLV